MKRGLMTKMILFILVPAILGLVLLAGMSYKMSEKILRSQIETDMTTVLQTQASGIHAVIMGLRDSLAIVSQNNRVTQYINLYNTGASDVLSSPQAAAVDNALREFTEVSKNITYSALIASDGKVLGHHVSGQNGPSKTVGTDFSKRPYFSAALKGGTDRVVLCHNHPNGVALPSREDIQATENIVRALGLVHVLLRDHIILTETEYFSMREENRLPFYDLATGEMLRPY